MISVYARLTSFDTCDAAAAHVSEHGLGAHSHFGIFVDDETGEVLHRFMTVEKQVPVMVTEYAIQRYDVGAVVYTNATGTR